MSIKEKWELITKGYDNEKPSCIRSEIFPNLVAGFNGIHNDPKKYQRAKQIVDIHNHLSENIDRMEILSSELRSDPKSEQASMIRELDSYIGELKDLMEND